jgi:hypothetical protein
MCRCSWNVATDKWKVHNGEIEMFMIDSIHVMLGGLVLQQRVGIPMGSNCAPLLVDLLFYSHEADFIQGLLKKKKKEASPIL